MGLTILGIMIASCCTSKWACGGRDLELPLLALPHLEVHLARLYQKERKYAAGFIIIVRFCF